MLLKNKYDQKRPTTRTLRKASEKLNMDLVDLLREIELRQSKKKSNQLD